MKRKIPLILLCVIFLGIAGYSGLGLYREWLEYRAGEQVYEDLTQYIQMEEPTVPDSPPLEATPVLEPHPNTEPTEPQTEPEVTEAPPEETAPPDDTVWPEVDFEALREINPDVVGWIYIEGTSVNYPVVQGRNNSEYLDRLFDGTQNKAGSIFMDYRNEPDLSGRNTILYGHHLQSGAMFHDIILYKDQSFYEAHPTALLLTPEGNYKIRLVAGYVTDMNSDAWKMEFESDVEFALWLEQGITQSTFQSTVRPTGGDRVVTFSTCTYEYNDARYVLVGVIQEMT